MPISGAARPSTSTSFYQYKSDRVRRTLQGIDQQVANAVKAVAVQARSNGTG